MSRLLRLAALAVCFTAADTYVVVLALPDMMTATDIPVDALQRAAPIVSGFLLGYVALQPLAGRLSDLHGRRPVLLAGLLLFAAGSLVTASSYDLATMAGGRFLQGLGAGALVPATLALVADLYPREARGVPLGWVGAAQELGSVLGPLLGALVLAVGGWRDIFWLNLVVGLALALLVVLARRAPTLMEMLDSATVGRAAPTTGERLSRLLTVPTAVLAGAAIAVVMLQPAKLVTSVTWGGPFVPWAGLSAQGAGRWWSPAGVVALMLLVALLLALRPWHAAALLRGVDAIGALLVAVALGAVVVAFAGADTSPDQRQAATLFGERTWWSLAIALVAAAVFALRSARARTPLVSPRTFAPSSAWGSLVVGLFTGAALVAVLVDVPIAVRVTVGHTTQTTAALVLLQLLVAVPLGAVLGGPLLRVVPARLLAGAALLLVALGLALLARLSAFGGGHATFPLVVAGLGFGLAIAPVNAVLLEATPADDHGIASALLVVARMSGMIAGLGVLTAIGLHRFYDAADALPSVTSVCGSTHRCAAYDDLLHHLALTQAHTMLAGAAVCALVAAAVALATLRRTDDPGPDAKVGHVTLPQPRRSDLPRRDPR